MIGKDSVMKRYSFSFRSAAKVCVLPSIRPSVTNMYKNKNDNIHKNEVQQIRWADEYWQYRVAVNIKEYHIISKLILKSIGQFRHTYRKL